MNTRIATLKVEINSVLVSAGSEITVPQLETDYENLVRKPIPYREAGFCSVEDLIKNIPDAVTTRWVNGQLKLRAVMNSSNQHIAKFVSLAKNKPKSAYRPPTTGPPRTQKRSYPQKFPQQFAAVNCLETAAMSRITKESETQASFSMLRGQIINLMVGYRTGLRGSQFADAFARRFGTYKRLTDAGYPNILTLLQAMPDVVDIEFIEDSDDFYVRGKLPRTSALGNGLSMINHQNVSNKQTPTFERTVSPPSNGFHVTNGKPESSNSLEDPIDDWKVQLNDSDCLETRVQKVLSLHPKGIYASKFLEAYEKVHGSKLYVKKFGYDTIIELIGSLHDVAVIERPTNGDWIIFDKRTFSKDLLRNGSLQDQRFNQTSSLLEFRECLRVVLERYPQGVLQSDLEEVYENLNQRTFEPCQFKFASLEGLLEEVSDIAEVDYIGNGRVLIKSVQNTKKGVRKEDASSLQKFVDNSDTSSDSIPMDAVTETLFSYPSETLPEPGVDFIRVTVSDVKDPGSFWFQLGSSNLDLAIIMDELQVFYNRPSSQRYYIPNEMVKVDLPCVAKYFESQEWHRCTITELRDGFAKVLYVDYGTSAFVPKQALRFITWKFFLNCPALAVRGRLARVLPINEQWTSAAVDRFFSLVVDRDLQAMITEVSTDNVFTICLCDTTGEDDVHISDLLIEEDHARLEGGGKVKAALPPDPATRALQPNDVEAKCNRSLLSDNVDDDLALFGAADVGSSVFGSTDTGTGKRQLNVHAMPFVPDSTGSVARGRSDELPTDMQPLFKPVQLTDDYVIHIVNVDGKAYVISSEVSALFGEDSDIRSMLRLRGMANVAKLVVMLSEKQELMQRLYDSKLPGTSKNGHLCDIIVLYELSSVVLILDVFSHPSEELKTAVKEQMDLFSPRDSYWTGKRSLENVDSEDSVSKKNYKEAWEKLQKDRELAISQMKTTSRTEMGQLVDRLEQIEADLLSLKENHEINSNNDQSPSELSHDVVGSSSVSIDHFVAQQGQSYLKRNANEESIATVKKNTNIDVNGNVTQGPSQTTSQHGGISADARTAPTNPRPSLPATQRHTSVIQHPNGTGDALANNLAAMSLAPIHAPVSRYPLPAGINAGNVPLSLPPSYPLQYGPGVAASIPILPPYSALPYAPTIVAPVPYGAMPAPGFLQPPPGVFPVQGLLPSLSAFSSLSQYSSNYPNGSFM